VTAKMLVQALILNCFALAAIMGQAKLTIDKVMTSEEMRATGVTSLTPIQRNALDTWLTQCTARVIQLVQSSGRGGAHPGSYGAVGGGHWIKSKGNNGAVIVLEDGSTWEIQLLDRIDTALWLPITSITVLEASSPVGEYRYTLINKDDGEKALAKYLGKE
jgi:hypothetical protein